MNVGAFLTEIAERAARIAAALAILFACAVMVHQHTHQADRAPYVAVDDALANVSASMVALGRNGFPASPIQGAAGKADPRRNEVQLNYGYAPFALGAALDWLFGTSYPVLRAIHVVGLILAIGAAWIAFGAQAPLATLLFSGIVSTVLWPTQWPMFRPDMGTALAGIVAISFAMAALRNNGLVAWLGTGFFAATAFGSHQIAWAMVPWAAAMWLVAVLLTEPGRRWSDITIGPFIAVVAGGLAGLLAYAWGIGWRLGDVVSMWTGYRDFVGGMSRLSYADVLAKHYWSAWGGIGRSWIAILYLGLAVGLIAGAVLIWRRHQLARPFAALALPGALAALAYLLGLGLYPNWHAGYTIMVQLATAWAAAAALAATIVLARHSVGGFGRPLLGAATLAGALLLAASSLRQAAVGTTWTAYTASYVSFSDYESRVFAEVPQGATAAGSVQFGLKSGKRHQLVQTADLMALLERLGPQSRTRMLPEHLVLNSELVDAARLFINAGSDMRPRTLATGSGLIGALGPFSAGGVVYSETAIVYAEPYGETRLLTRGGTGQPAVSLYDTATGTWSSRFGPADPPSTSSADVALAIRGEKARLKVDAGLMLRVEPGIYLVEVDIASRDGGTALVTGSTDPLIELDLGRVNPPGLASLGLALAGNRTQNVIVRAPHGTGYIGYFGSPLTRALAIGRIERLMTNPERTTPLALPPLAEWRVQVKGGKLVVADDSRSASIAGVGVPPGYQLASPPIQVPPDQRLTVHFEIAAAPAVLGLGVLDSRGAWIDAPARDGRLTIETGRNTSVRLVLTNLDGKAHAEPARFMLRIHGAASKNTYGPKRLYVDQMARCFVPPAKGEPLDVCR